MLLKEFIIFILQLLLVPILSPLAIGVVRKLKAKMQNRQGAKIIQPYFDLWKLFHKDEVISEDASWIFRFSPFIIFTVTVIASAAIPTLSTMTPFIVLGDFLVVIYMLALGTFFLALAGIDAGSSFGGFGSSREMTFAALTEAGLIFSLLTTALLAKTTHLPSIVASLPDLPFNFTAIPMLFAFIAFFIALLAENARVPVDNPATHLELTMVHEAMILEYSGKRLALIEWAAANKFLLFTFLAVTLFVPYGTATQNTFTALLISAILLIVKSCILLTAVAIIESSMAKLRVFRVPDLLFTSFIFSVIALLIIIF
jgi:formate hydrogenlyase subunit 4